MGRTTFSGPLRVGKTQKTSDAEFAGAVSLVATAYMADPTAATTTVLRRGSSATGSSAEAVILPANAIITKIEAEAGGSDPDELVFTTGGQERAKMDNNMSMSARGGFFTHNLAMHASETFTIASTEGTVAAGPLDVQGTVDVQGTLVVV